MPEGRILAQFVCATIKRPLKIKRHNMPPTARAGGVA
jgi:hypothetical protein